jgi:N-acyl-L-homoserine lactone synthetase
LVGRRDSDSVADQRSTEARVTAISVDPEERALVFDALARQILRDVSLEFRAADTPAEVDATFRLRHASVMENGWAAPGDFPDGRERDEHDDDAVHVVCLDGDEVVGSLRVVRPRAGRLLPTERDFGLRVSPPASAVEMGRIVVSRSHRATRTPLVLAGLFARGWLEARRMGYRRAIGAGTDRILALYRSLGVHLDVLGPPRRVRGEERSPVEFSGAADAVARAVARREAIDRVEDEAIGSGTRRDLLARAGGLAAGALLMIGVPEASAAAPGRRVGSGPTDRQTIGFVAQIDQAGVSLGSYGWLTRVEGLPESALYTRPPATSSSNPAAGDASTVRFTVVSEATIQAISTLGGVINTVAAGSVRLFFLPAGGARLDNPASFAPGSPIATMTATFQTNLALDSPDHAAATLGADLVQRSARAFTLDGRRSQLGRPGLAWSMRAVGRGVRTEPTTPRSQIALSGDMGVADAASSR